MDNNNSLLNEKGIEKEILVEIKWLKKLNFLLLAAVIGQAIGLVVFIFFR